MEKKNIMQRLKLLLKVHQKINIILISLKAKKMENRKQYFNMTLIYEHQITLFFC